MSADNMNQSQSGLPGYNFAYLDEQTKRMVRRRCLLKAVALPGYQVPFRRPGNAHGLMGGAPAASR